MPRALALALLLTGSLAFAAGVLELGLRVAGIDFPEFHRFDPVLGSSLRPGARGTFTREGHGLVEINAAGLRGPERALAKPPDVLRIAILGDSFTQAFGVDLEETFWWRAASALEACPALAGRRVEAIGFGVSGHGTASALLTLRHRALAYDPDWVVLATFAGNDVRNNSRALQGSKGRPYFVLEGDELILDDRFRAREEAQERGLGRQLKSWLEEHSRLVRLVDTMLDRIKRRREANAYAAPAIPGDGPGLTPLVFAPPRNADWEDAWHVTEALHARLFAEVRDAGARPLLLTVSASIQVNPDADLRRRFATAIGSDDLFYPDRRLDGLARGEDVPHVMLAPELLRFAEEAGRCVHGFEGTWPCGGHWNEVGHRLAGEALAAALCAAESGPALPAR